MDCPGFIFMAERPSRYFTELQRGNEYVQRGLGWADGHGREHQMPQYRFYNLEKDQAVIARTN
jgi:hypothetical protein